MAQPGLGFLIWEMVYHIHLLNRMTSDDPPLTVHVKSKNDNLKERTVRKDGDFHFKFKPSFWGNTLFYCIFKHGDKTKVFDVFKSGDYKHEKLTCRLHRQRSLYWKVQEDGFYRSCDDEGYVKMYDWRKR
ncbi:hypothetical protein V6N13_117916 [Hibiscus sabdariffa]